MRAPCLAIFVLLVGCAAAPKPATDITQRQRQINEGYTLLYSLMHKDRDVDKILIIKSTSAQTAAIINDIAAVCNDAVKQLDRFAEDDEALRLDSPTVPAVEEATRDAIEAATARDLLTTRGEPFEVRLLLSQSDATGYAARLAWTLRDFDPHADRRAWLDQLTRRFDQLNGRVKERLTLKQQLASHQGQ